MVKEVLPDIISKIHIRTPVQDDMPFIYSSWLKSYRGTDFAKNITNSVYYEYHHNVIEDLINNSTIVLATDINDTTHIMAYIIAAKINGLLTVHYLYVKHTYRRLGIGKTLFSIFDKDTDSPICYTHETSLGGRIASKYKLTYNPYLIVMPKGKETE